MGSFVTIDRVNAFYAFAQVVQMHEIKNKFIGIQIKPIASGQALNQYQWIEMHKVNHTKFEREFGGKVFFVYSSKNSAGKKTIYNTDVIEQNSNEIIRLNN